MDTRETEVLQDIGPSTVEFSDQRVGTLMEEWIKDAANLETAYDEARLQFPDPSLRLGW